MNAYKHITKSFQTEYKTRPSPEEQAHTVAGARALWSASGSPQTSHRARELGYKAKQGITMARVKVERGLSMRPKPHRGRKPSKYGRYFAYRKSLQARAEDRAARKFSNCEVLNSYFVRIGRDQQVLRGHIGRQGASGDAQRRRLRTDSKHDGQVLQGPHQRRQEAQGNHKEGLRNDAEQAEHKAQPESDQGSLGVRLPSAKLRIELGKSAKGHFRILDKKDVYKRSKVKYRSSNGALEITVTASDPVALVSSLNGVLKQLRIITTVDKVTSKLLAE